MVLLPNLEHLNVDLGELPLQYTPNDNPFISNEEISFLLKCAVRKNGNMLEIGVNKGRTTNNLARVAKGEGLKFIGIDVTEVPKTICDAQNPGECLPSNMVGCEIMDQHKPYVEIKLINPNNPNSLSELLSQLNLKFDFVFVDGDHSYEGVKKDYNAIMPFMTENGLVVFHDVWWDVTPPPVKGPLKLLSEIGGYIINNTHLGIAKNHKEKI